MRGRLIQLVLKVALVVALLWVGRRALIRWVDGPARIPTEPWPPLEATAGPAAPGEEGAPAPADLPGPPVAAPVPAAADAPAEAADSTGAEVSPTARDDASSPADRDPPPAPPAPDPGVRLPAEAAWLPPDEAGVCPPTHPVKAKRSTRLYREPGTAAYERARPDRCYASVEAAEADGFTRAKR